MTFFPSVTTRQNLTWVISSLSIIQLRVFLGYLSYWTEISRVVGFKSSISSRMSSLLFKLSSHMFTGRSHMRDTVPVRGSKPQSACAIPSRQDVSALVSYATLYRDMLAFDAMSTRWQDVLRWSRRCTIVDACTHHRRPSTLPRCGSRFCPIF